MQQKVQDFYEFGGYRLVPSEGLLLREDEPVPLPPKAFDTLVVLVQHHGHVVSKEDLMAAVWPDTFVEEANLTHNISLLRKALGDPAEGQGFIDTVPKRGYRFVAPVRLVGEEPGKVLIQERTRAQLTYEVEDSSPKRSSRSRLGWAAVVLAAGMVGGLVWSQWRWPEPAPAERIMLVVLPFQNLSGDPEQEYFSDGLTEEMIAQLGRLNPGRLGVIARTSAMQYKQNRKSVREVGQELGVDYALEGSVRRAGDRVRVTAQFIRVSDESQVWAETFDSDWVNVLDIQEEVAEKIAGSLTLELRPNWEATLVARTASPEAHDAYLKGRYFVNKRTREDFERALSFFQRAIAADPEYALAYAGVAETYNLLGSYEFLAPKEAYPKAEAAARRALERDSSLGEAYASLGWAKYRFSWDWTGAEADFRRGITLNPGDAVVHDWYSKYLASMERFEEAHRESQLARTLDPLHPVWKTTKAWLFYSARRYDETIEQCQETLRTTPDHAWGHAVLGYAYNEKGMHEEAIEAYKKAITFSGGSPMFISYLGRAYGLAGRHTEAREVLKQLQEASRERYVPAGGVALVYAGLGETDEAFRWLEKAYEEREIHLTAPHVAWFDPLRSDPRFQSLLQRLDFPEQESQVVESR